MIKIGKHEIPEEPGVYKIPGGTITITEWNVRVEVGADGRTASRCGRSTHDSVAAALKYLCTDAARDTRYWRARADITKRTASIRKDEAAEIARLQKKIADVKKRAAAERKRAPRAVASATRQLTKCERKMAAIRSWGVK